MPSERILATYWIETPWPLEQAAQSLAGEQFTSRASAETLATPRKPGTCVAVVPNHCEENAR